MRSTRLPVLRPCIVATLIIVVLFGTTTALVSATARNNHGIYNYTQEEES